MTKDEALKLALEALKYPINQSHENFNVDMAELLAHRAITAIKEALAQPEQEPVAILHRYPSKCRMTVEYTDEITEVREGSWPLYTTPPQSKPLTDEEFRAILRSLSRQQGWDGDGWDLALKEAIEAAHGIGCETTLVKGEA